MTRYMTFKDGIDVDVNQTFGELQFLQSKGQNIGTDENGELTGEIKDRRYEVFSTAQRQAYTVVLPADIPEKDFAFRQKVKLVNPVFTNYAIPNNNFLPRVGIRITANDLIEDKGIDKVTKPSNPTEIKK